MRGFGGLWNAPLKLIKLFKSSRQRSTVTSGKLEIGEFDEHGQLNESLLVMGFDAIRSDRTSRAEDWRTSIPNNELSSLLFIARRTNRSWYGMQMAWIRAAQYSVSNFEWSTGTSRCRNWSCPAWPSTSRRSRSTANSWTFEPSAPWRIRSSSRAARVEIVNYGEFRM